MIQEKRFGLSAVQQSDMWRRWKARQSLHEIGARLARTIRPLVVWCRVRVGLSGSAARYARLPWPSERRSLGRSRFTALVKVPSKDTAVAVAALARHVRKLPTALRAP
jgi:hypothetical protein